MSPYKVSIVAPVYNEEELVSEYCDRVIKVVNNINIDYELILINDGSSDSSYDQMKSYASKNKHIKLINLSRNFGHQVAISSGMNESSGDAVIVMDSDLQDPPEEIPEMIQKWKNGYDVVYAVRKKRKGESIFKKITAKLYYKILKRLTNISIPVDTGDFRLLDRKVIATFREFKEGHRFIRGIISWIGFKQTAHYYIRDKRKAGDTKYPLKKMTELAIDGITSFSSKPLMIAGFIGTCVSFFSFVYIIYTIINKFLGNNIPGYTSLMAAILFLGGVQLLTIGFLGVYIGRIYDEVKNRPLYVVSEKVNF